MKPPGQIPNNSGMTTFSTAAPWTRRLESAAATSDSTDRARRLARLRMLARLMDNAFQIPGTGVRFGLDSLLGLIPGAGDALTAGVSLYIVYEAAMLGATKRQLALMLGNIALDTAAGSVPVLGDLFDLTFKANILNLRMMGIEVGQS
jgi:Domain of unknown function (DUF4112)